MMTDANETLMEILNRVKKLERKSYGGIVNAASAGALDGTEELGIIKNSQLVKTTTQDIADLRPYKVYTALLTQTGTDAPVATVLENTLGDTVVWSYVATGKYRATLLGAFPLLKTFTILGGGDSASFYSSYNEEDGAPSNSIMIEMYDVNINNVDNELINSSIEIRVYPA